MRSAYITAGAAGMFCGSCMRDNTLVAALTQLGHDALLIPTYTPLRTDEVDVSQHRVFFGGINVYLQQKWGFFRHTPWFLDRLLDGRGLLNWVSRFAVRTQAEDLGELMLSMLRGEHGKQRKELDKLLSWLSAEVKPDLINFSNVLLSGLAGPMRDHLKVPLLGTLQGDDIFLEALPAKYKEPALELVRENCGAFAGFIATSRYYADFMSEYLRIPREKIHVVYPGINLDGHGPVARTAERPYTIGYLARICPEKGVHVLADAYRRFRAAPGAPPARLRISGWLGGNQTAFFNDLLAKLRESGLGDEVDHVECPDHVSKVDFLRSLDVLSVPTTYREPKGIYVLEAWANGVPVVQPGHGSFPELIAATGGGKLVNPDDPADLALALRDLYDNTDERRRMGTNGHAAVVRDFTARVMAERTLEVYGRYVGGS